MEEVDNAEAAARERAAKMAVGDRGVLDRYKRVCRAAEERRAEKDKIDADVELQQARLSLSPRLCVGWCETQCSRHAALLR